jgi:hypothetical protein
MRRLDMPTLTPDYELMRKVCLAPWSYFQKYGRVWTSGTSKYIYKQNNANILAVAHLDSVHGHNHFGLIESKDETRIYCPTLDDRLGAYLILEFLPLFGLKYDILLTDNEETGNTSAKIFNLPKGKKYNWMFSFDRHGDDVVHYRYYEIRKYLEQAGFGSTEISHGAFSCIDSLDKLECLGANFGTGYHEEHNLWAYAVMGETIKNVNRFLDFYDKFANQHLEYKSTPITTYPSHGEEDWEGYGRNQPILTNWWHIKCIFCEKIFTYADARDGIYKNVCLACEKLCRECLGCEAVYMPIEGVDDFDLCQDCIHDLQQGKTKRTRVRCAVCNKKLWTDEIVEGCHNFKAHDNIKKYNTSKKKQDETLTQPQLDMTVHKLGGHIL